MKVDLTIKELRFINLAIRHSEGVFDYENYSTNEFEKAHGMTKNESYATLEGLRRKINKLKDKWSFDSWKDAKMDE